MLVLLGAQTGDSNINLVLKNILSCCGLSEFIPTERLLCCFPAVKRNRSQELGFFRGYFDANERGSLSLKRWRVTGIHYKSSTSSQNAFLCIAKLCKQQVGSARSYFINHFSDQVWQV